MRMVICKPVEGRLSEGDLRGGGWAGTDKNLIMRYFPEKPELFTENRRRFTEAVLSGASAGVIGVNAEGRITVWAQCAIGLIASLCRAK